MQHKGVSCGPLSFIHAAAACELPAWQSCRRVLWHPVDSSSHSSIRGPRSRAGAHLHEKYMDTVLTYVTVTTIFLFFISRDSGSVLFLNRQNTTTSESLWGYSPRAVLSHISVGWRCVFMSTAGYVVHNVAPRSRAVLPLGPSGYSQGSCPAAQKARTSHCCPRSLGPASLQICTNPPSACWQRD